MLYEDENVSRIAEAMTLFESITNSRWFAKSTIMLFVRLASLWLFRRRIFIEASLQLNKTDIFRNKIQHSPLSHYLPEYQGNDSDYNQTTAFMQHLFARLYRPQQVHQGLYVVSSRHLASAAERVRRSCTSGSTLRARPTPARSRWSCKLSRIRVSSTASDLRWLHTRLTQTSTVLKERFADAGLL